MCQTFSFAQLLNYLSYIVHIISSYLATRY
nr:MAG TPA: hypothetical protein [Caudoviricetes sp.]